MRARAAISAAPAAVLLVALAVLSPVAARAQSPDFYSTRPAFERPVPAQRVPRGLKTLGAAECGTCHVQIYREWQQSVHALAWPDPQFQAELKKQPGVSWLCVNCHTPLVNQLDSLVTGLRNADVEKPLKRANPDFSRDLKQESITCASCHVRNGTVEGPFQTPRAPHATRFNAEFRKVDICLRCHQAVQSYPGKNFVCTFETGKEWKRGYYSRLGVVCQDCHMPGAYRPLATGGPERRTGRHTWIGSHIRKGLEPDTTLWNTVAAMTRVGVELTAGPAPQGAAGSRGAWQVKVANANAGHDLPTGDPERCVEVELSAVRAGGRVLAQTQTRIGQKYQWTPVVKKLADTRLKPRQDMTLTLKYRIPKGQYKLIARAVNVRISDENADYHHLGAAYPRRAEVARVVVPGRPISGG